MRPGDGASVPRILHHHAMGAVIANVIELPGYRSYLLTVGPCKDLHARIAQWRELDLAYAAYASGNPEDMWWN
jgi:hypothetical protein